MHTILVLASVFLLPLMTITHAQQPGTHYDESKVHTYTLPNPLEGVASADEWPSRRETILNLFRGHMYGRCPEANDDFRFEIVERGTTLDGTAKRIQIKLDFGPKSPDAILLLHVPVQASGPVPVFLGANFRGNFTTQTNPKILNLTPDIARVKPKDAQPGKFAGRWPLPTIIDRGYGLATIFCGDITPDDKATWKTGVHADYPDPSKNWAAISAWAWGLSRCLDALQFIPEVDGKKVAVIGHSRLGKTALWAGARDERFAMVISNNSGCGGAALSRRAFGETVEVITRNFPHWFCAKFKTYAGKEASLPLDQHMLVALAAPRPVYIASASGDRWADPKGEFLAGFHADPVYKLLGTEGILTDQPPAPGAYSHGTIGVHNREGRHNITEWDWLRYLDFADKHLGLHL